MAQSNYTPILLYHSTTASAVPTAGNLAAGELALNIPDGKLYYNNAGTVELLASQGTTAGVFNNDLTVNSLTIGQGANPSANNTALGQSVLGLASSGAGNTGVGYLALGNVDTGSGNLAIGYESGYSITSGSNNSILGGYTGFGAPISSTGDNFIVLSDGAGNVPVYWQGTTGAMYVNGSAGTSGQVLTSAGSGATPTWTTVGGSGTVTSVSVVTANGFTGAVANQTTTPAITLNTTVTGILQGNGSAISAASTTGSGNVVLATSPTLVTPNLGTPSTLVGTNITGTATGLSIGGNAATVTNGVYTTDTGTVTNTMLAGSIANTKLLNSSITVNGNLVSLGGSTTVTADTPNALTFNTSGGATSGTSFNGSALVTVDYSTVGASPLAGSTSLTTVGTIGTGTWAGTAIAITHGGTGQTTASAGFNALSPITATGDLIIGNGVNSATNLPIGSNGYILTSNGTTASWAAPATSGTVTTVSVVTANGFAGTVANATSTPAITISTGVTGLLYGNGTAVAAATAAQVVGVIGATAVTNATNAANVTLAAASSATNYVVMGGSATGNVAELTDTAFTFNATTHVITGGISGGGF